MPRNDGSGTSSDGDLAYAPQTVAELTLQEVERRRGQRSGVSFGLAGPDGVVNPLRPGELVVVLGRPSHYKTGLMQWWARSLATSLRGSGRGVAYCTTEMAIEELGIYDLSNLANLDAREVSRGRVSDEELAEIRRASMDRATIPLWLLGHSLSTRKKRVRISVYTIEKALFWIEDHAEFTAEAVFLDYLNLMQSDRRGGYESRRTDISEIVQCCKDMALFMGAPVVLAAQARREVDDRDWQMPTIRDGMESAAIEQYADKVLAVWMPHVSGKEGQVRAPSGQVWEVDEHLLLLALLKQKNGPSRGLWPLYVDQGHNFVGPWEERSEVWYEEPIPF